MKDEYMTEVTKRVASLPEDRSTRPWVLEAVWDGRAQTMGYQATEDACKQWAQNLLINSVFVDMVWRPSMNYKGDKVAWWEYQEVKSGKMWARVCQGSGDLAFDTMEIKAVDND